MLFRSQAVIDEDGIVNKFLGDGVMALFRGPSCSKRAVKCAFSMVDRFYKMKECWNSSSNQQLDFLDLGVGITTDQVIIGGIGTGSLRDYTAIGTAVNLAAAFEVAARDGKRILCDQITYRNAMELVSDVEPINDFLLKKPGQEVGIRYKCYSLKSRYTKQEAHVFISHSHQDREYVEQLISQLEERGVKTWYSVSDIRKGTLWTAEIRKAISRCNWMTVIVSKNSANSKWIQREIDLAVTAAHLEDRIIPVAIDNTKLIEVNEYLSTMQAIFFDTCDDVAKIGRAHV